MLLIHLLIQDSSAYDSGYTIGYAIGKYLPFVVLVVIAFFLFRYFKNKSKK
ncbi:hypothetical protein WNY78_11665 [Psychroserpens sp. AS72]|uniref:hypothetical protein n=1 Tax=Psychroserpens sp. AS72 TaxID=3135775 RepID=UPI00317139E7